MRRASTQFLAGSVICLAVVTVAARTTDLTLIVVTPFGKPLGGCQVDRFKALGPQALDYRSHFRGLEAVDIPPGVYDVKVLCGNIEIYKNPMSLDGGHSFRVLSSRERVMISEGKQPLLTITLNSHVNLAEEIWWIRLTGVYNEEDYSAQFQSVTGETSVAVPDPGSYLVTVLSSAGYNCVRRINIDEFTRAWKFSPEHCLFQTDRYAYVEGASGSSSDAGLQLWNEQMRRDKSAFRDQIRDSLRKTP